MFQKATKAQSVKLWDSFYEGVGGVTALLYKLYLEFSCIWVGVLLVPYSVMLDSVAVPDGEGEVVPPGLGVPDEEGSVFILTQEQLLLCLQSLYLPEVPAETRNINDGQFALNYRQ